MMTRLSARTRQGIGAGVLLLLVVIVAGVLISRGSAPVQEQPVTPGQMLTMDPRIIANLTALPNATPLSGQAANDLTGLEQMVQACADYTAPRRDQMIEQIGFIIDPTKLSGDVIIALGANSSGRLLQAVGYVTVDQWGLLKKPANSCLVPIGKRINELLVAAGEVPLAAFN